MIVLAKTNEGIQRLIILLLLILILFFIIVGYIAKLIKKVMKRQGEELDTMMHDMVVTHVVNNKKQYRRIALKKSKNKFFKDARISLLILLVCGILTLIISLIYKACGLKLDFFDFGAKINEELENVNTSGGTGFNTLLYKWDIKAKSNIEPKQGILKILGTEITFNWAPLVNKPHFSAIAIPSYILVPGMIVGIIWNLLSVQAYISRLLRLRYLIKANLEKSLEGYNQAKSGFVNPNQNQNNTDSSTNI